MATTTVKRTARTLTKVIDIDYTEAKSRVSEAISELRIERVRYNENLRSWEIATADANALVESLAEAHV